MTASKGVSKRVNYSFMLPDCVKDILKKHFLLNLG